MTHDLGPDLTPAEAERAREVREVGFVDANGREHEPWTEERYYGIADHYEPYELPVVRTNRGRG